MSKPLYTYTDGAAKGNSKNSDAGWGIFIPEFTFKDYGFLIGTNNIAELYAILRLLEVLRTFKIIGLIEKDRLIVINTDSKYSIGVLDEGNKVNANKELVKHIKDLRLELLTKYGIKTTFNHVPGHSKEDTMTAKCNNVVDMLASESAKKQGLLYEAID